MHREQLVARLKAALDELYALDVWTDDQADEFNRLALDLAAAQGGSTVSAVLSALERRAKSRRGSARV